MPTENLFANTSNLPSREASLLTPSDVTPSLGFGPMLNEPYKLGYKRSWETNKKPVEINDKTTRFATFEHYKNNR
jgi:hypothetical protein